MLAAGLEGQNACGIGVSEAAGSGARGRGWGVHRGRPPRLRVQNRPEPPGAGRRPGRAWTLPRGAFDHAARADELAQLGAGQHHLALVVFVVRGGYAVGAHALAERVGFLRQQLLQPHAIEAAALYGRHPGYSRVRALSASRPRASTAYGRRPWRTRSLARPHAVVGSGMRSWARAARGRVAGAGQAAPAPRPRRP